MTAIKDHLALEWLLRPPGAGIPVFSAGKGIALPLQIRMYSQIKRRSVAENELDSLWKASLAGLSNAKALLLGVPLDTGAGIRRGAAHGPRAIRERLVEMPEYVELLREGKLIDIGDLFVNPHLLHDSMLNQNQIRRCQEAMYPDVPEGVRGQLAVSALSQTKQLLQLLSGKFPQLKIFVLGGDHSIAWPITEVLSDQYPKTLGIIQSDAHTDLLPSRLGVEYCFGTWSYHANRKLGADGKMVQLGIRQSGKPQSHWEKTTGIKQFWSQELHQQSDSESIDRILSHLKSKGVKQVYFSNDIDGTDEAEAKATGTPAPGGLSSRFLLELIDRLGEEFEIVASDIMEVAPDLGPTQEETQRTLHLAADYTVASLRKMCR